MSTSPSGTGATARSSTRCTSAREAGARSARVVPPRSRARRAAARSQSARPPVITPRDVGGPETLTAPRRARARCSLPPHSAHALTAPRSQTLPPDPATYRTVLGHFATGVAIITAVDGEEPVGMACNSFTSVSLEPQLVLFCAAKSSTTWPRIHAAGKWAANILDEDGEAVCRLFAQKGADRFVASCVHDRAHRLTDPGSLARVRRLRDDRRASTRATMSSSSAAWSSSATRPEGKPLLFYRGGYGRFEI